jgi:hypothetical protein
VVERSVSRHVTQRAGDDFEAAIVKAIRSIVVGAVTSLAAAGAATAQPSVKAVKGTVAHGETLTIAGANFDAKAGQTPLRWDDFQSVGIGKEIVTSTAPGARWTNNAKGHGNQFNPIASAKRLRPNTPYTRNMESHWQQPSGGTNTTSNVALIDQNIQKFFLDAWFYNDVTGLKPKNGCCNVKHVRLHQRDAGAPNLGFTDEGPVGQVFGTAGDDRAQPHSNASDYATNAELYGRWMHIQWLIDPGGGGSGLKGKSRIYVNGELRVTNDANNFLKDGYAGWSELYLGNYWRSQDYEGDVYAHWEAVMIDHGWNRVELADNANYSQSRHREIQPWLTWSPTGITVQVNRGSFRPGERAFVCVVDNQNRAACHGPHVIGADRSGK